MPSRYLVTGGCGFLGSACVRRLVEEGHRVRVFDNLSRGRARRLRDVASEIEMIEADVRDAALLRTAVRGVDEVLHFAFLNGTELFYEEPELVLDIGLRGMLNLLDACRSERVGRLVLASSSEVYQEPPSVPTPETVPLTVPDVLNPRYSYGGGKLVCELLAVNWGRSGFDRVIIFRPHNIYGPDMGWEHVIPQFCLQFLQRADATPAGSVPFAVKGSGAQTRSFCHVDDFTDGLMQLLAKGRHLGIYNIGNPEEVSVAELARRIGGFFGRAIEIRQTAAFAGETQRRCPDIAELRALGYAPQVSLDRGLAETLAWYAGNRHLRAERTGIRERLLRCGGLP